MRPLLVGEANPYGADPRAALFPLPERAAGGRLCEILGLSRGEYLRRFDRCNLCLQRWDLHQARHAAREILISRGTAAPIVLLGAKVAKAFGSPGAAFGHIAFAFGGYLGGVPGFAVVEARYATDGPLFRFVLLPHPSGLNRAWNHPGAFERARETMRRGECL